MVVINQQQLSLDSMHFANEFCIAGECVYQKNFQWYVRLNSLVQLTGQSNVYQDLRNIY